MLACSNGWGGAGSAVDAAMHAPNDPWGRIKTRSNRSRMSRRSHKQADQRAYAGWSRTCPDEAAASAGAERRSHAQTHPRARPATCTSDDSRVHESPSSRGLQDARIPRRLMNSTALDQRPLEARSLTRRLLVDGPRLRAVSGAGSHTPSVDQEPPARPSVHAAHDTPNCRLNAHVTGRTRRLYQRFATEASTLLS